MEYSEFEDIGYTEAEESEEEGEICTTYYPGQLSDMLDELNEAQGRKLEDRLFLGTP